MAVAEDDDTRDQTAADRGRLRGVREFFSRTGP
jgi:hypothetical protein